jgi:hypothetical protein
VIGPIPEIDANDERVSDIAALVRAELAREAGAGFPTLLRVSSTGVVKFLDFFDTLAPADRAPLLDTLARLGALHFFPAPLIARAHEQVRTTDPALPRLSAAMQGPEFAHGFRYGDLRMTRMMLNDRESVARIAETRSKLDFQPRDDLPERFVGTTPIRDIRPAKAPLLRKLLNPMLTRRLSTTAQKRPGGELVYEGAIGPVPLRVSIIFSNMYGQMHYAVTWSMRERTLLAQRLTYEALWGANTGWDYLTEENAAASIEVLDELLVRLAQLFERIAELPARA